MKKSFLKTCIILSFFGVFLMGDVNISIAQVYFPPGTNPAGGYTPVPQKSSGSTGFWDCLVNPIACAVGTGAEAAIKISSLGLYLTGNIFDTIINYTVSDQKLFKGIEPSIDVSWKIVRDIANIFIVFSLLYLGIKTIFNGNGFAETKTLISIIIAAILINFSLLITQAVFDISNTIGSQIAQQITFGGKSGTAAISGISDGLTQMIRPDKLTDILMQASKDSWQEIWEKVQIGIFTSTSILILAAVFLGASILLMYRFLIFTVLMITSPVGITSKFVPWFEKIGDWWWKTLKSQSIVLPAFLLTLYVSVMFVSVLSANLGHTTISSAGLTNGTAEKIAGGLVTFVFNYLLIIGFLLLPLIVPGKIGAAGSDMMTGVANWTTNKIKSAPKRFAQRSGQFAAGGTARAGRAVLGGVVGGSLKASPKMKKWAQEGGFIKRNIGQAVIASGAGLQNRTYDVRNIDAIGKSDFGKGMGKGIEGWSKALEAKKKKIETRKKDEMKLFGFDKMHETPENMVRLSRAERARDVEQGRVDDRKRKYDEAKADPTVSDSQLELYAKAVKRAEKRLEEKELLVGQFRNRGEFEYVKQLEKRWVGGSSPKITTKGGFYSTTDDLLKKWKTEGQSKSKKKKKAESNWLDNAASGNTSNPPPPPDDTSTSPPTI
jgi:hypothetical protein